MTEIEAIQTIVSRLKVAKQEGPWYRCYCPCHDDNRPSLTVRLYEDSGYILIKCMAGCNPTDILSKIGLKWSDLRKRDDSKSFNASSRRIVATYQYTDENGNTLYEVVRYEPKSFSVRRIKEDGTYEHNLNGVRHVLYNLPLLKSYAHSIYIVFVEGEKCAEAVTNLGFVGTCICNGANSKWCPEYEEQLKGIEMLTIICDSDEPGRQFARRLVANIARIVPKIAVVDLFPTSNDGLDVCDYIESCKAKNTDPASELYKIITAAHDKPDVSSIVCFLDVPEIPVGKPF